MNRILFLLLLAVVACSAARDDSDPGVNKGLGALVSTKNMDSYGQL